MLHCILFELCSFNNRYNYSVGDTITAYIQMNRTTFINN